MFAANEIALRRITNQRLAGNEVQTPQAVVAWLGAVQAQDFAMSKWALGLRMVQATEQAVEAAYNRGDILRTHVLRPTWHYLTPSDLRWMLALTGPRVLANAAGRFRQLELDEATFHRSRDVFIRALSGGHALTRDELRRQLEVEGISSAGQRMPYLLMHAELNGLLVSGPRNGKQHTFMLLDERVPSFPTLPREEATGELARRFFRGHGPATLRDFCWWSGLTAADARAGIAANGGGLLEDKIDGRSYWFTDEPAAVLPDPTALLLPVYDEMMVGHTDRSAYLERLGKTPPGPRDSGTMQNLLLVSGQIVGAWSRSERKNRIEIRLTLFTDLTGAETAVVEEATRRFGDYYGLPVEATAPKGP